MPMARPVKFDQFGFGSVFQFGLNEKLPLMFSVIPSFVAK